MSILSHEETGCDDRRELWVLLSKLPPPRRVEFARYCCTKVKRPAGRNYPIAVYPRHIVDGAMRSDDMSDRLTNLVYADLIAAAHQYRLDLDATARTLERYVKAQR